MSETKTAQEMVREFHRVFGHPCPPEGDGVVSLPVGLRELRLALIHEEFEELLEASGFGLRLKPYTTAVSDCDRVTGLTEVHPSVWPKQDPIEMADALGDLIYVIYGFAIVMGIDLDQVVAEIHDSNMSKLGADGKPIYRADGKVLKGPNYRAPDIASVIVF